VNTGRLFRDGPEWPSAGAVVSYLKGVKKEDMFPPFHFPMPGWEIETGLAVGKGYGPGYLGDRVPSWYGGVGVDDTVLRHLVDNNLLDTFDPRYGMNSLGQNCYWASGGVAAPIGRFITINQFSTVFDSPSWDCHAASGALACDLGDYRDTVAPSFDTAFTQLVTDLDQRGLLDRTLVVATGEFGRTPKFNCNGGRDHWPGVWTTVFAGGGVKGGRVIGSSDAIGSEPKDLPVHARDIPATIFHALGIGVDATIPGPDGLPVRVYEGRPVTELF
jgi:hypothetical protein